MGLLGEREKPLFFAFLGNEGLHICMFKDTRGRLELRLKNCRMVMMSFDSVQLVASKS
ncbi:unnamed protein product [Trifolium pratense]|uniref:Uncharacterized protein n=1 Tax=Trifolium pratense TaxID=57577 RepID=A0ACB0JEA7_TRIPR|nr:unnamed protein product [Trifolium pratense]